MSDLYDVKALKRNKATVELRVRIVHPDVDDFPDTKNFALQLLLDALYEAPGPLRKAVSSDQRCDETWMLTNATRFVAEVDLIAAENWPRPALKALPDDDGSGAPREDPVVVYRIRATSPSHVAHIRRDLVWQTAAYDMGEDGFPDDAEPAPEKPTADEPEKPPRLYGPPGAPPDLTVLTARNGQKLRAVLRRFDRVHDLLKEAGVYASVLGFVHRESVQTLTPWLLRFVEDEAEVVRRSAVWLLGDLGASEGGEALIRIVESNQVPGLRLLAIRALADLPELPAGGPRALARVVGAPEVFSPRNQAEHDLAELPTAAATALARQHPLAPEIAPELIAALGRQREAMGQVGVNSDNRAIYSMVKTPDWPVVHWLGSALSNMGWSALPRLTEALADERTGVRVGVLQALSQLMIREPDAARAHDAQLARATVLFEQLVKSPVVEVRANAAVALCTRDPGRTHAFIGPLGEAIAQGNWGAAVGIRLQAGRLLAALGDAALPAFWQMLEMRKSVWGRYFENTPLVSLGIAARPLMEEALARGTIARADMAVWSALVGAPDAFQRLADVGADSRVRHGLLARAGQEGLQAIRALLDDPRADINHIASAIEGLGRAGDAADAEPLLARALAHPRYAVRARAVRALAERGGSSSRALLKQALDDSRRFIRASAAGALCRLGEPAGAAALEALWAQDPERVEMTIADHKAPCVGLCDRLLEALAHPQLATGAANALAAIAGTLPPSDTRARIVDAIQRAPGSAYFRRTRETALAENGLVPPFEDPFTSGSPPGWLGY
jgi:HEAT repeat protein